MSIIAKYFRQKSEKLLQYKEAAIDIRDQMEIMDTIVNVLKPKSLSKFFGGNDTIAPFSNRSNSGGNGSLKLYEDK